MAKSARNSKTCMSSGTNAGINQKVKSSCPPDLTDGIKKALLKEIEEFKADPENEVLVQRSAERSAVGGPALEAYQDWLAHHEGQETVEANPDIVAEEEGFKYLPSNKDPELLGLLKEFRQSLTPREVQVWNLVMHLQLSQREAAKLLNIKQQVVLIYLNRSKKKFNKFVEAIKREKKD